jgi:hypothetical protein
LSQKRLEIADFLVENGADGLMGEISLNYCRNTKYPNLIQISAGNFADLSLKIVRESVGLVLDESNDFQVEFQVENQL